MTKTENPNITAAKRILQGQDRGAKELWELATALRAEKQFSYARRLLALARNKPEVESDARERLRFAQKHALCTYKDPDLPAAERLDLAWKILEGVEDLPRTRNQESLGLAGAICKRRWDLNGQRQHLERSLAYYRRGYQVGPVTDQGYTGINAAFVLDLLASLDPGGLGTETARARGDEAQRIRQDLVETLPPLLDDPANGWLMKEWWFYAMLAEAHFGLAQYPPAVDWLRRGEQQVSNVAPWEYETTVRQLATLARLHGETTSPSATEPSAAWNALREFLGPARAAGLQTVFAGKVGLALSGGGFRASLFHIGVLAKLAELDMLRHVEVLSCVSGGSIVGAQYYLELRKLLREKADTDIQQEHYIGIVQNLACDFLAGVQENIRTRVAASLLGNLQRFRKVVWFSGLREARRRF